MEAILALEDGTVFRGAAAGAEGEAGGEVVFNTSMTGYQEVLTDPSYAGQIVTMTCPEIGNYGVSNADVESRAPQVAGFIIRDESPVASNWRSEMTLREYLVANRIVAISDIDTRALTRQLRSGGVMRGVIATGNALDVKALVDHANAVPQMEGSDLVSGVTAKAAFDWPQEDPDEFGDRTREAPKAADEDRRLRLRHEVEHPAAAQRARLRRSCLSCWDAGRRTARDQTRRRLSQQRSRRSRAAQLRDRQCPCAGCLERAGFRHLPRSPDSRSGDGRQHVQAEIRSPRRESSGEEPVGPARSRSPRRITASRSIRRRCQTMSR